MDAFNEIVSVCGKILLYGEYTVLVGGNALAVPLRNLRCRAEFGLKSKVSKFSNSELLKYEVFLQEQGLGEHLDLKKFRKDLNEGMWYRSEIPMLSGLGSSGAVVALTLKLYGNTILHNLNLMNLHAVLKIMESYFHGNSSGIDPLVSYLEKPIAILNGVVVVADLKGPKKFSWFITQSSGHGITKNLVAKFKSKIENKLYHERIEKQLKPLNNSLIDAMMSGDGNSLIFFSKEMGRIWPILFPWLVPKKSEMDRIKYLQKEDLAWFKICGSGGGGFMLGLTQRINELSDLYKEGSWFEIEI